MQRSKAKQNGAGLVIQLCTFFQPFNALGHHFTGDKGSLNNPTLPNFLENIFQLFHAATTSLAPHIANTSIFGTAPHSLRKIFTSQPLARMKSICSKNSPSSNARAASGTTTRVSPFGFTVAPIHSSQATVAADALRWAGVSPFRDGLDRSKRYVFLISWAGDCVRVEGG